MIAELTISDEVVIGFVSAAFAALLATIGVLWKIILRVAAENREERDRMRKFWNEQMDKGGKSKPPED